MALPSLALNCIPIAINKCFKINLVLKMVSNKLQMQIKDSKTLVICKLLGILEGF